MNRTAFGQRLKFLRKIEGLTQAKLAEAVNVTVEHLSNVERGASSPSFELIMRLALSLHTEPANLFLFAPFHLTEAEEEASQETLEGLDWRRYVTHIGGFIIHLDEGRTEWSDGLYRLLGYRPGEIEPGIETFRTRVHPDDLASLEDFRRRLRVDAPVCDLTMRLERKDGIPRLAVCRVEVDRDPDGRPVRLSGLLLDITEQKRFEQSLMATRQKMEQQIRQRTAVLRRVVRRLEREAGERTRTEQRLTETTERLRRVLETITDGYWDRNLATGETYFSPSCSGMLGYPPDEARRTPEAFLQLLHPEDRLHIREMIAAALRAHPTDRFEFQFRLRGRGGHWHWVLSRGRALEWGPDGSPLRLAGVQTDITAIHEVERALRVSERRLQLAQRITGIGSWEVLKDQEPDWWSDNLYRLLGYEPGQVPPSRRRFLRHVLPEDRPILLALMRQRAASEAPFSLEYRIVRTDGAMRHIRTTGAPLDHGANGRNGDNGLGGPGGYAGTIQDITEWRRSEAALAESEKRLRLTFDLAPVSMALVGPDCRFLRVNRKLCAFLGYSESELAGRTFMDITHPDDVADDLRQAEAVLRGDLDHYTMRKRYVRKDGGMVWGMLFVRLVRDARGRPAYFLPSILEIDGRGEPALDSDRKSLCLKALFDDDPRPLAVLDPPGRVLRVTPAFARRLGRKTESLTGLDLTDLSADPAGPDPLPTLLAVAGGGPAADLRLRPSEGAPLPARLRRLADDRGRTLCLVLELSEPPRPNAESGNAGI